MENKERYIVNPVAVQNCSLSFGEWTLPIVDISGVRVVAEDGGASLVGAPSGAFVGSFSLNRYKFEAMLELKSQRDGWVRFGILKIVPSARAHLRSFLCPKKVGESLIEDWRNDQLRHFHGLNESELWFVPEGGVIFTYLDQTDPDAQFLIRVRDLRSPLQVGKILRHDYIGMESMESELPLIPLGDREVYAKLSECRDIVTNFRPTGQTEYNLKQKLLKVISDSLYSTSNRVEMSNLRPKSQPPASAERN